MCFLLNLDFQWNESAVLLSGQRLLLVLYLNILLSSYSTFWNKDNNLLCNHLLDQLQFLECYHIFLNHFLLADQKLFPMNHNIVICFYRWRKISCLILTALFSNDRAKSLFTTWKLRSTKYCCRHFWLIFIPIFILLKPGFNCSSSFALSWVDNVTTRT